MVGCTVRRYSRRVAPALLGALLIASATGRSPARASDVSASRSTPATQPRVPDDARQKQLMYLLAQDCGSCHGMSLRGGLGPALTPEALAGKPPVMLRDVILHGRPGTPMPPWKGFLTEREAEWLVQVLLNGRAP